MSSGEGGATGGGGAHGSTTLLQDHHRAAAGPASLMNMMGSAAEGALEAGAGLMMNGLSVGRIHSNNLLDVNIDHHQQQQQQEENHQGMMRAPSRYEAQKRRDWNTFGQYLRNHRPPLALARCTGQHVLDFVRYLDQFGKTKVHLPACPFFGHPHPPHPCPCPLRQAWGSLDALVGRLRAAFEENGGRPESNPFGARTVRLYLREVRETQAKARGIAYEKKKRKRLVPGPAGCQSDAATATAAAISSNTSTTVASVHHAVQLPTAATL